MVDYNSILCNREWDRFDTIVVVSALTAFSGLIIHKNGFITLGLILFLVGFTVMIVDTIIANKERGIGKK